MGFVAKKIKNKNKKYTGEIAQPPPLPLLPSKIK